MATVRCCLFLLAVAFSGCGGSSPGPDAGAGLDASVTATDQGVDAAAADAGDPDAAESPDSGLLPFGAMCTAGPECETNFCFNFNARGQLCTAPCAAGQCPIAGHTCNNMGVCRP